MLVSVLLAAARFQQLPAALKQHPRDIQMMILLTLLTCAHHCFELLVSVLLAAVRFPQLPPALTQHPREAATLLEAALRTVMSGQDLQQCNIAALTAFSWLNMACKMMQRLQDEFSTSWQAEPAAARQLFGLAASVLKSADVVCCSSFTSRLGSSSSSSKYVLSMAIIRSDGAVHAIAQEGFPAALRLLLHARLVASVGKVCSLSSSAAWADQMAPVAAGYRMLHSVLGSTDDCATLLGEVQLPGEAAAAAEAAQQLQQQAAELRIVLQQQLTVLEEAGDAELLQAAAPPTSSAAALEQLQGQQEAKLAGAPEQNQQAATAGTSQTAASEATQAAAASDPVGSNNMDVNLQQEVTRVFPGDLAQQLQQFGEAVCYQLPVSLWCCNPRCTNLQQQSEAELVGGKGCVCAGCHTARFCSRQCLEQCWSKQLHKGVCRRIAAASQQQQQQ
jgi:hypothetical protein